MQFIVNPDKYDDIDERTADVNGDGVITPEDATIIRNYVLGVINYF